MCILSCKDTIKKREQDKIVKKTGMSHCRPCQFLFISESLFYSCGIITTSTRLPAFSSSAANAEIASGVRALTASR